MAKNPPKGPGRVGAVKGRDQVHNPKNNRYVKRDENKKFMDQKADSKPFKGVRKVVAKKAPAAKSAVKKSSSKAPRPPRARGK